MAHPDTSDATVPPSGAEDTEQQAHSPVEADDLVEDVSIDGMCGVY